MDRSIIRKVHFFPFLSLIFFSKYCMLISVSKIMQRCSRNKSAPNSLQGNQSWGSQCDILAWTFHTFSTFIPTCTNAYSDIDGPRHCFYKISSYFKHCFKLAFLSEQYFFTPNEITCGYTHFFWICLCVNTRDEPFWFYILSNEAICRPLKK